MDILELASLQKRIEAPARRTLCSGFNPRLHVLRTRDCVSGDRLRLTFDQHSAILRTLLPGDAKLAPVNTRRHA
jgi:hypothetical protein